MCSFRIFNVCWACSVFYKDIEENDTFIEDEEEIIENKGESKVVKVMNVIIVILVIIFIALLGVILYQSFF